MKRLTAYKELEIHFSEVDSMGIVWHGSYPLYFEDAREAFGAKYDLGYMKIFGSGYYAPLVELDFKFKKALRYESKPVVRIDYIPTESAKIVFEYTISDRDTDDVIATGRSVQVFMDRKYELVWESPAFYREWQQKWEVL